MVNVLDVAEVRVEVPEVPVEIRDIPARKDSSSSSNCDNTDILKDAQKKAEEEEAER